MRLSFLRRPPVCGRQLGLLVTATLAAQLAAAQAPALLSLQPGRHAAAAPADGPWRLTFSAPLDAATVGQVLVAGQQHARRRITASLTSGPQLLTLTGAGLWAGERVSVTVPGTVRGTSGQAVQPLVYRLTAAVDGPGRGLFIQNPDAAGVLGTSEQQLGDVDGDGDLDLLVINNAVANAVQVRLNNRIGFFGTGTSVSVGGAPTNTALADVDNDGDLDVVASVATGTGTALSVRLNDGRGSFGGGSVLPGLTAGGHILATADLDGDGDQDVVLATNTAGQTAASVRLNDGQGNFGGGSELGIAGGTGAFTLGDLDNDGDLDFITTGFSTSNLYTCLNQGNGRFGSPTVCAIGNNPASVALADLDGDGNLDVLAGCARTNTVEVRLGNGQGQFAASGSSVAVGNYPQLLGLADLDSDGDLDLLTSNLYGNSVSVRFNQGGTFGGGSEQALGQPATGLALGDVDGDHDVDFVTSASPGAGFTSGSVRVGFNQAPPAPSCTAADTVATLSPAGGVVLGCGPAPASLSVAPVVAGATYEWQRAPAAGGAWQVLPAASLPTYQPTQPGRYRVRVQRGGCVALSAAVGVQGAGSQLLVVPNIFTPNGDGLNDRFEVRLTAPLTSVLRIYSRWGREVFRSSEYGDFWTGAACADGLYFYVWRYTTACDAAEQTLRGTITLVR